MIRWLKRLGITLVLAGLLLAGAVLALNGFIASDYFAGQIQTAALRLTGVPVQFRNVEWDMGRGITLHGFRVENPEPGGPPGLFAVPTLHLKYGWETFLGLKFDVNRLTFKDPLLEVHLRPDGEFVTPINEAAAEAFRTGQPKPRFLDVGVNAFNVDKGRLAVNDADGQKLLQILGGHVEGKANPEGDRVMRGIAKVQQVILWDKIHLLYMRSPFAFKKGSVTLSALEGDAYGGRLNGSWEQHLLEASMPFNLKLNLEGVDLNYFLAQAFQRPGMISGRLEATTVWLGPSANPREVSGEGRVVVKNGQVISAPLFEELAERVGGLRALSQADFSEARIDFKVSKHTIELAYIEIKAPLFEVAGQGRMGFDLKLEGELWLKLGPELGQQIPTEIALLWPAGSDGTRSFPFRLAGTLLEPRLESPLVDATPLRELARDDGGR